MFDGYSTSIVIAWCREQFYYNSMLLNMSVLCPNQSNLFPNEPPHLLRLRAIMRLVPRIRKYILRRYRLLPVIQARRDPSEPEHYVLIDVCRHNESGCLAAAA